MFPYTNKELPGKKKKESNDHICNSIKNNKIFRSKFNQESDRCLLQKQDTDKRNQSTNKWKGMCS